MEIHDALTPEYFKYFQNNGYKHLLGLSATIDSKQLYLDDQGNEFNKIDMLNSIAPIVYKYTVTQGQEDDTSRKLKIFVIKHHLDYKDKSVKVSYKDKKTGEDKWFEQSEKEYYVYCQQRFVQAMYAKAKSDFLVRYWANRRNSVLINSKSKTKEIKRLLEFLDRTIVFGNSIVELETICPTVSSHNTKEENEQIISDFQEGRLNTIGSFKMLKQGKNLIGLDNVVMHSYYSVEKDFIQRIGRLRKKEGHLGCVFIYVTDNTQENVWFGKIMNTIKMDYIHCENTEDAIEKYLALKK